MMQDTRVRDARIEDVPEIARIHVAMWRQAYRAYLPPALLDGLSVAARERSWRRELAAPRDRVFLLVAIRDTRIVGFCSLGPCRDADASVDTGEVYAIYVAPGQARRGIGSTLMRAALHRLAAAGFRTARLWVLTENAPARAFYEHRGWMADGATKAETVPGGELRETRYIRSLGDSGTASPDRDDDA